MKKLLTIGVFLVWAVLLWSFFYNENQEEENDQEFSTQSVSYYCSAEWCIESEYTLNWVDVFATQAECSQNCCPNCGWWIGFNLNTYICSPDWREVTDNTCYSETLSFDPINWSYPIGSTICLSSNPPDSSCNREWDIVCCDGTSVADMSKCPADLNWNALWCVSCCDGTSVAFAYECPYDLNWPAPGCGGEVWPTWEECDFESFYDYDEEQNPWFDAWEDMNLAELLLTDKWCPADKICDINWDWEFNSYDVDIMTQIVTQRLDWWDLETILASNVCGETSCVLACDNSRESDENTDGSEYNCCTYSNYLNWDCSYEEYVTDYSSEECR